MQRFAPVVDYFEVAVNKVHSRTGSPTETSPSEPPQYQYQRAFALSKDLSDQLYSYSTEQINQLKAQNALVQKAAEAAQKVSAVASTGYGAAQERVHGLSNTMVQELQKVQVCFIVEIDSPEKLRHLSRVRLLSFQLPYNHPSMISLPTSLPLFMTLRLF